jgi:DNA-binding NtrC family response regulator
MDLVIKKVLLADDDENIIDSLTLWVEAIAILKGALILTAMTAEKTEETIIKELPELVFLDLGLGNGISGLDILKRVKPIVGDKCQIFVFSGYKEYAEECLKNGASGFIKKVRDLMSL